MASKKLIQCISCSKKETLLKSPKIPFDQLKVFVGYCFDRPNKIREQVKDCNELNNKYLY